LYNFHKRLAEACAASDDIPDHGKGQQTYLAERLGVSQEAVRKWLAGETTPRSNMAQRLSKILNVKHSWLMLGTTHGEIDADIKVAKRHEASVYALMSYLVAKNIGATFTGEEYFHDIMFISQGSVTNICAQTAVEIEKNSFSVTFTENQIAHGVQVILVCDFSGTKSVAYDFLQVEPYVWKEHGKKSGNAVKIEFTRSARGNVYSAGDMKLKPFLEE